MKPKKPQTRIAAMLLSVVMISGALAACSPENPADTGSEDDSQASQSTVKGDGIEGNTRAETTEQLGKIQKKYDADPGDEQTAIEYAGLQYKLGNFVETKQVLEPLLERDDVDPQVVLMVAELEYLQGNYKQSLAYYETISEVKGYEQKVRDGMMMNYYQLNEYVKGGALMTEDDDSEQGQMMKAFGDRKPYQVDWTGEEEEAVVPFDITDPLPIVSMEINGKLVDVLIDTGAPEFFVDEQLASELGIQPISEGSGEGGGGHTADISFGIADSIAVEGVTVRNVPVIIFPTRQYTGIYQTGEYQYDDVQVDGIVGTKFLQQFLSSMDYPREQLVLRPRNTAGSGGAAETAVPEGAEVLPFYLADDHYMIGQVMTNGEPLNYFYDSGLDDPGDLLLPTHTLNYLGIPIPEIDSENEVGGFGGAYTYGAFQVDSIKLGKFQHNDVTGLYGIFPESLYDELPFYCDGLISHKLLKNYCWTIDFDTMTMTFSK